MTDLFPLPSDLRGVRAVFLELGERDDPRFIAPLVFGEMQGLQWRRVRPGSDLERPTQPIPWFVIVDDRATGASGPNSFDPATLQWLFSDAYRIAVDAAEPHMGLYEYFVEEALKRMRILVVHMVESRFGVWREFSRQNCELYGIAEVVPVEHDPDRRRAYVTRFEGRSPPRQ
jgi:hypothetical protein